MEILLLSKINMYTTLNTALLYIKCAKKTINERFEFNDVSIK